MKEEELRLGVNVLYKGQVIAIDDCERIGDCEQYPNDYSGIPLTEEWLVNFGFTRHCRVKVLNAYEYTLRIDETNLDIEVQQGYQGDNNRFRVNLSVDGEEYAEEPQSINNAWLNHIRYVHQLQNLYFALTGEELKLTASQSNQIE